MLNFFQLLSKSTFKCNASKTNLIKMEELQPCRTNFGMTIRQCSLLIYSSELNYYMLSKHLSQKLMRSHNIYVRKVQTLLAVLRCYMTLQALWRDDATFDQVIIYILSCDNVNNAISSLVGRNEIVNYLEQFSVLQFIKIMRSPFLSSTQPVHSVHTHKSIDSTHGSIVVEETTYRSSDRCN